MNHSIPLSIVVGLLVVPTLGITQQAKPTRVPPPKTISQAAQRFLEQDFGISSLDAKTHEEWQEAREIREDLGKSWYEASRHKYKGPAEIQTFEDANGVKVLVYKLTPKNCNPKHKEKAIFHIHGGGFCFMSPESTYCVNAPVANMTGLQVYSVKYRLAPEHAFPAALDDCFTAYKEIIKQVRPENLAILGESAGASLGFTTLLKAEQAGLPMPAAFACISPCVDLTMSSDTIKTFDGLDPVLKPKLMRKFLGAYAGTTDLHDPLLSPYFGEFTQKFPPTIIQTGTRDLLLSDCARMHQKLKASGVDAELSVREGMWHGFHILPNNEFPEAEAAFQELASFLREKMKL